MHIDGTLLDKHVITPHLVEQLIARMHAFGMRHQEMQQTEFGGAEIDLTTCRENAVR